MRDGDVRRVATRCRAPLLRATTTRSRDKRATAVSDFSRRPTRLGNSLPFARATDTRAFRFAEGTELHINTASRATWTGRLDFD
jgi:hypothetical protein